MVYTRVFIIGLLLPLLAAGQSIPEEPRAESNSSAQDLPQVPADAAPPVSPDSITKAPSAETRYHPITAPERLEWFAVQSVGSESLLLGIFSAGIGTARDKPVEYGPSWKGFAERYGMRLTGVATSNAMEAAIGSIWGEDPRYFTMRGQPFRKRLKQVIVMTFAARGRNGKLQPDYASFIAIPGSNFLSNTWRADSESTASAALERTALGFAVRIASNAYQEFWPDVRRRIFRGKN